MSQVYNKMGNAQWEQMVLTKAKLNFKKKKKFVY